MLGNYGNLPFPAYKKFDSTVSSRNPECNVYPLVSRQGHARQDRNSAVNQYACAWRSRLKQVFWFSSYSAHMNVDRQTDGPPVDGFYPNFDRNLQIVYKDHIPNFIPVALIVFELSCSQTDTQT
ncbi:hypothetical protein AVEN_115737-1, partial [Araneus ventricosus]